MDPKYRNLYSEHYYKFKNNSINWKVGNLSFEALSINIQTIILSMSFDRHSCKLCMKTAEYFWTLWSSCLWSGHQTSQNEGIIFPYQKLVNLKF